MTFDEKELEVIVAKKIDKIIFQSKGNNVFFVDIDSLLKKRIEEDPNLRKQLVTDALRSPS